MSKNLNNVIFDVGSNDGLDGLILAILNPNMFIFAFEPNKEINEIALSNKLKLENEFNTKINNHKIIETGVSNINGEADFYIGVNSLTSSLLNYKDFDTSLNKKFVHKKKIKIPIIKLSKFIKENNIKNICYIHIDVEGLDLQVIEGLDDKITNVYKGVLEAPKNNELSLYKQGHSVNDVYEFFEKKNLEIKKITGADFRNVNIHFKNNNFIKNNFFSYPITNYNVRYIRRIFENRKNIRDMFRKIFMKYRIKKILNEKNN
tara:strand:- start:450 stop:1232 length:783 start_codon:yes stop_codon:yes gene_type:complete